MTRAQLGWCWIGVLGIAASAAAAPADDALQQFNTLYAQEIRRVQATPGYEDDQQLAAHLFEIAQKRRSQPVLMEALCNAVFDLSDNTPEGFPLALKAMELVARHVPQKAGEYTERLLSIRRRQYSAARTPDDKQAAGNVLLEALCTVAEGAAAAKDYARALKYARQAVSVAASIRSPRIRELQAWVRRLTSLDQVWTQVRQMKAQLELEPTDAAARRRLIDLYVIELDNPTDAVPLLGKEPDERLRTYVPLAAQAPGDLAAQACFELAQWYQSLVARASREGKVPMLVRARTYCDEFLAKHQTKDPKRAQVELALKRIMAELKRLDPSLIGSGQWVDLLKLVDTSKHVVLGRWWRKGGSVGITSRMHGRVVIPLAPKGSYELKTEFTRTAGDNDINFILPVGKTAVVLMLSSANGEASGLSAVNGSFCEKNETRTSGKVANNVRHTIHARVTVQGDAARIYATLDGKRLVNWQGPQSALSAPSTWRLPNQAVLGLGADTGSAVAFHTARLRMLSGTAERVSVTMPSRRREDPSRRDRPSREERIRRWRESRRRRRRDR